MMIEIFHKTQQDMAFTLATSIADNLRQALKQKGHALLILPGGSSPQLLITQLARQRLDWQHITVTTTDERCVSLEDPQSNAGQILRLCAAERISINLISLWQDGKLNEDAINALFWLADVTVLGMGTDGHIASLFPDASSHIESGRLTFAQAPGLPHERISLTMEALHDTYRLILLVVGERKKALCQAILNGKHLDLPLARLIKDGKQDLEIHIVNNEVGKM